MAGKGEASKKPDKAGLGDPLYEPKDSKTEVEYARHRLIPLPVAFVPGSVS